MLCFYMFLFTYKEKCKLFIWYNRNTGRKPASSVQYENLRVEYGCDYKLALVNERPLVAFLWYNRLNGGAIGKLSCQMQFLWGETMIRPIRLEPLNRGCVETIVYEAVAQDSNGNETPIDLSNKKLYLTAKTSPWDTDADDSDAVFKVLGTNSGNRVTFSLTSTQTYIDPTVLYYFDIVQTDSDGSNPTRLAIGTFNVIGGANNAQAGGE